jgi:DnaJ-domain-containing protein 1
VHGRQGNGEPPVPPRADHDVTSDLDGSPVNEDRAAQYRDWADRLRAKRVTAKRRIQGPPAEAPPSYWNTDDVYRESRRLIDEEVPPRTDPVVQDLLAVFGIVGEPAPRQVETAFRRLAKEHHPDRHIDDDEATRSFHLDQMRRINEAYSRLRQLELA